MSTSHEISWKHIANELTAGYIGGMAYILAGQPLDIIKVRFQSLNENSIFTSAKNILYKEGILAFWKGSFFPLITVGFSNSLLFTSYDYLKMNLKAYRGVDKTSFLEHFITGSLAGLVYASTICPFEHVKIRMQIQQDGGATSQYKNSIDCAKQLYSKYGISGLYKGLTITCLRELVGCGVYFAVYFYFKDLLQVESSLSTLILGGTSGVITWNFVFWIDNLKSKIQSDDFIKPVCKGRHFWMNLPYRSLVAGYIPGMAKSFPSNAANFYAYELTGKYLSE